MTLSEEWLRSAGETIDRLVTADLRWGGMDLPSLFHDLYAAAREAEGDPLSYAAARALASEVDPLDTVLVVTGAGMDPWVPRGESDGPPGAVGLAHGLAVALGARPVIAVEGRSIEPVVAAARGGGLTDVPYEDLRHRNRAVSVVEYPAGPENAEAAAGRFMEYDPAAVVAVERIAPNRDGEMNVQAGGFQGYDYEGGNAWVGPLFERAREAGVLTVGVGDRGNEAGFGKIESEVRDLYAPEGMASIATDVAADRLVAAGTSNWGAYGIEAMLALLAGSPEAMHTPDDESRALEGFVAAGGVDAVSLASRPTVDGISETAQRAVVALLGELVENRLSERGFDRESVRAAESDPE